MKIEQLQNLFMSWGWYAPHSQWVGFLNYASTMLKRNRVLIVKNENNIEAILFYFITNDIEPYLKKSIWSTPEDLIEGTIIYVDKIACKCWTPSIRKLLRPVIEETFPFADELVYHRPRRNRRVRIKRRGVLV